MTTHPDAEEFLITESLRTRPFREPDYEAENRVLAELAEAYSRNPLDVLEKLVDSVLALCGADSAGISIFGVEAGKRVCHIEAVAGAFAGFKDACLPLDQCPCGMVLEQEKTLLLERPWRRFQLLRTFEPPIFENLQIPFAVQGKLIGSLWALSHSADNHFDSEDARVLESLSRFAAAGYQMTDALQKADRAWHESERQLQLLAQSHEALRRSEERFRLTADNAPVLIWIADITSACVWFNRPWLSFVGRSMDQEIGVGWADNVHPDDFQRCLQVYTTSFEARRSFTMEYRLKRHDGDYRWLLDNGIPLQEEDGTFTGFIGSCVDITNMKNAEHALQQAHRELEERVVQRTSELQYRADQLARLTSELTLSEQRERRRLAKILHDHLQQLLVGAKYGLDVLSRRLSTTHGREVQKAIELLDEAISTSRTLTVELSPPILHEAGLAAGLEWLARRMKEKYDFEMLLHVDERAVPPREDLTVLIFEAVRELLRNSIRHGQVNSASVELVLHDPERLRVVVADQGHGFMPDDVLCDNRRAKGGFGLFSIRERLTLLRGQFHIDSAPGQGARITIIAPLHQKDQSPDEAVGLQPTSPPPGEARQQPESLPPVSHIRLLLADDHVVVRQGLTAVLAAEPDLTIIGEAGNGIDALEKAQLLNPDIVLMDFSMPGMDGVEATRRLRGKLPHIQVIGLSMYEEPDRSAAIIKAGAAAYVSKSGQPQHLVETIRKVYSETRIAELPQ